MYFLTMFSLDVILTTFISKITTITIILSTSVNKSWRDYLSSIRCNDLVFS